MPAKSDPRESATHPGPTEYYFRRSLTARQLLPAIGAGLAAGAAVFYLTQLFLQRTPLTAEALESPRRRKIIRRARTA
jgi:hypothetical protein